MEPTEMTCALCQGPARPSVCDTCATYLAGILRQVPRWYSDAHVELPPGARRSDEWVTGSGPGPRSPVRDDVLGTADQLARELVAWEAFTLDLVGLPRLTPARVRLGYAVARAVDVLVAHLADALGHPSGIWYASRVLRLAERLHRVLGLEHLVYRLEAPCQECDCRALTVENGTEVVACGMCGATTTVEAYSTRANELIQTAQNVAHSDATQVVPVQDGGLEPDQARHELEHPHNDNRR